MLKIPADEHETENGENGNDRDDESVFRETLSFLAVKVQEHAASFPKRRLAFRRGDRADRDEIDMVLMTRPSASAYA